MSFCQYNVMFYDMNVAMYFYRNQRGQSALRELLQPLVKGVLDDRKLIINTNPVEVSG